MQLYVSVIVILYYSELQRDYPILDRPIIYRLQTVSKTNVFDTQGTLRRARLQFEEGYFSPFAD
jgi:hypothetical protein